MSAAPAADPCPAEFNMARYTIGRAAAATPEKAALQVYNSAILAASVVEPVEEWRFHDLDIAVRQFASALHDRGLQRGDRVAIHLGNSSRSALLFFGAIAGGMIALPLSDQLTPRELEFVLEDSGAALLATANPEASTCARRGTAVLMAEDVEEMFWDQTGKYCGSPLAYADTRADDPAFLIYTSGTTAQPKGVLHAHRSAWGRRPMYQGWYGISAEDRMLHAGSFNWTYTLGVGLTDPWANGATALIYVSEKKPENWPPIIALTEATLFAAVPGVFRQILAYANPTPDDLGRLRHGLVAGETPPADLFDTWRSATGRPLYEALGMSEISTYISTGPDVPRRAGFVGKAQAGRRVAILLREEGAEPVASGVEGLIAVHRSDPGLMLGYWNRADESREVYRGDWFCGGDLGVMDADGYIAHLGRANELMNAGGFRVSPLEVEGVIAEAPGVAEVACAEVEVKAGVRIIAAFIVPRSEARADIKAIDAFATERLAAYKRPREIVIVEALPRTANGKIKRSALRLPERT